jgi:tRNA (guanine-N7-)-methyltransferase
MLPRCAILLNDTRLDPARLFRPGLAGVALEVGFGGGEHLAVLAREKPDWGFLGCEPYLNGVAQLLVKIEEARLDNIRLYRGDARDVIERLPHASLDAVYVLFPDPWPKRRHWKRRFVAPEMLSSLARVMRGGGRAPHRDRFGRLCAVDAGKDPHGAKLHLARLGSHKLACAAPGRARDAL